jgi:hypothetical protein
MMGEDGFAALVFFVPQCYCFCAEGGSMKYLLAVLLLVSSAFAKDTFQAWVSDEMCASGRAKDGVYTGTNPDCAKRCVGEGQSIVLISESKKMLFHVDNPDLLKPEVGNLVEITGTISGDKVHVDSVKEVEVGRAICERPKKK